METEAAAVAARIREMVGNEEVVDKETGDTGNPVPGYRHLLRAVSGWSETFRVCSRRLEFRLTVHQKQGTFPRRKLLRC